MKVKNIRKYLTEEQITERVKAMGEQISKDYGGETVYLICILKGSIFFTCELAKRITSPVVKIGKDLDTTIEGKNVLVVEDIIDSGRTLSYLLQNLKTRNPKSLKLCTLLDKPDRRVCDVKVDYVGFEIPDEFVVGFGLDLDQQYRNLPYIGCVELEDEE